MRYFVSCAHIFLVESVSMLWTIRSGMNSDEHRRRGLPPFGGPDQI
jgi:hypothetical protein